jgi:hypothetical protein
MWLAATATQYRVDAPNADTPPERGLGSESQYEHPAPTAHQPSDGLSTWLPQPHVRERTWRVDQASPAARRSSKILPRSNPFAIPASSLDDALVPLARFAVMFVLFTIAGTTMLVAGKSNRSKPDATPPAAATTGPLLEPTTIIEQARPAVDQPAAASTATGPAGDTAAQPRDETNTLPAFPDVFAAPSDASLGRKESSGGQVTSDRAAEEPRPAESAVEFLMSPPIGSGRPLPRVQTSEPPRAVAHFPGHVLESPSQQASNVDEQSVY